MSRFLEFLFVVCCTSTCLSALESGSAKSHSAAQAIGKSGISIPAKSSQHCLQLCNNHKQCDAANYHTLSGKCRLILRCMSYKLVSSNKHQHFAKRPPIKEKGFIYDDNTDSCLKVIEKFTDYQDADAACRNVNGRLAALTQPEINKMATKLLREAGVQYAWIGLTDNFEEGNPTHSSGVKVSETGFFPKASQGHRNDTSRNCWSLKDSGEWSEQSCKEGKHYSICQIAPF